MYMCCPHLSILLPFCTQLCPLCHLPADMLLSWMQDGKLILTGWSDGKIRAYGPESGQEKLVIHDAHHGAICALAGTHDSARIISGGSDGKVRVWDVHTHTLIADMVEHQVMPGCNRGGEARP